MTCRVPSFSTLTVFLKAPPGPPMFFLEAPPRPPHGDAWPPHPNFVTGGADGGAARPPHIISCMGNPGMGGTRSTVQNSTVLDQKFLISKVVSQKIFGASRLFSLSLSEY